MTGSAAPETRPMGATSAPARVSGTESPEGPAGLRSYRRPFLFTVLGVAAISLVVFGVPKWNFTRTHESTENAQVEGHIVPIVARVGGFVSEVRVAENQHVKAGDTLVVLDALEYRARLSQAVADLDAARDVAGGRGVTGQSETVVRGATSARAVREAQVTLARAALAKARTDFGRVLELADKQIVSRQSLDGAQWSVQSATADLELAERQLAGAGAGVENAQAGSRLALSRLAAAEAVRENATLQQSYAVIRAPRDGVVSRKQVDPGQLVQAGQAVLTIVDDQQVWVSANFKETQLSTLKVGQPAEFEVDAYRGCRALGEVESFGAATGAKFALIPPDNATGNFTKVVQRVPVRLRVTTGCGEARPLRPGLSVTAHVKTR